MMNMARLSAITAATVLMASCATQPPYAAPRLVLPASWTNIEQAGDAARQPLSGGDARWWTGLHDPAIDTLVEAALADNPTLAEAGARLDAARAAFAAAGAENTPRVGYTGSAARAQVPASANAAGSPESTGQTSLAIEPALSWEIDLWGRVRETRLAAQRRLRAREADAEGARLSIASQVADYAVMLRACKLLLEVRGSDIASREAEIAIIRTRVRYGNLAPADASAAESNLVAVRIDQISQEEACRRTVNALVSVTGRPAADIQPLFSAPLPAGEAAPLSLRDRPDLAARLPAAPALVPGLPATIILARPDVVAAEREVAARWSEIAVARAERLPKLELTAILTGQWIRSLGSTSSLLTGSIASGLSGDIVDGGARGAAIDGADARYREAVATLNATLRLAVRDIEDALAAQESAIRRVEASRSGLIAAQLTLRANEARFRAGAISAFELEDSRRRLNAAQESAVLAARDRGRAWIELVRRTGTIGAVTVAARPGDPVSLVSPAVQAARFNVMVPRK